MDNIFSSFFLLGFGFVTGIRHGFDLDHIAAITDIVSSQPLRARGLFYSTLYAVGHGVMVVVLGLLVMTVGQSLPESVDRVFGKIVGVTLVLLAFYVFYSLIRDSSAVKLKSRWMLIFDAIKVGYHNHPKVKEQKYEAKTAFGVGLIHGVGAETPTQIAAFVVLVGIGGGAGAILFLLLFALGIFVSNLAVAIFASASFVKAKQRKPFYLIIGILTGLFSLAVGVKFLVS